MAALSLHVGSAKWGAAGLAALKERFGLERLPFAPAYFELELKGVPVAVANAVRRVVLDELPGHCLEVPKDGHDSAVSDPLMLPELVGHRVSQIPLCPQVPAEVAKGLRLGLDVVNDGPGPRSVYAGDLQPEGDAKLRAPLFNPTFELASVQPGRRLRLSGIRIVTGRGCDKAQFQVARRAALRHLDIEQFSAAETCEPGGEARDSSGYKVSTLVANPQHHIVSAYMPAVDPARAGEEIRGVLVRACANVRERLRRLAPAVGQKEGRRGAVYTSVRLPSGLVEARLTIHGETPTIGELLRRTVFDTKPGIDFVAWAPTPEGIVLTLRDPAATQLLSEAIQSAERVMAKLQDDIGQLPVLPGPAGAALSTGRPGPAPEDRKTSGKAKPERPT